METDAHKIKNFESFQKTITYIEGMQARDEDFSATDTVYDQYRYSRKLLASALSFTDTDGALAESK